ncbi:MAG: helix-turn-helix transcriptional regulator [Bacteroidota bacterium]
MVKNEFPVYDIYTLSGYTQQDIQISRFAPYLQVHKNLHLPHKHNFYHLVLFTEGAGHHTIDFEQFGVRPWQVYFMIPGQVHSWAFEGPVDGYVINFSMPFLNSFLLVPDYLDQFLFFNGNAADSVIDIPVQAQPGIRHIMEQIIGESQNNQRLVADMVRALMLQLFIGISRINPKYQQQQQSTAYNYTLLKNFRKLIEENFTKLKLPKDYAALLYITPNHLNALCNDILGQPAGELIRNRVALEAKRLLINFNLNITEVSYRLNFADNSYFSKFFKKQTGLSPEEFRKQILKTTDHENNKLR